MTDIKIPNWKLTDNRFVVFLDILGFKDKVMRQSHKDIYNEMNKISSIIKNLEFVKQRDKLVYFNTTDIYVVSFSDSIIIFSKSDRTIDFEFILIALRYIFANCIKSGIPIKGSMAHGLLSVNKSEQIYFGQPIIDAYLLEEEVNYMGVVFHNSIDKYINDNMSYFKFTNQLYLKIKTPLKSGKIIHINLDWFYFASDRKNYSTEMKTDIQNYLNKFYLSVSGSPRRYVDNTLEFFEESLKLGLLNTTEIIL